MGKKGPCCHCGVTYTPLWRNGPPGKPVLCNACGSRWRTKGTLANYTPLHARLYTEPEDSQDIREGNLSSARTQWNQQHMKLHADGSMEDRDTFASDHSCPAGFHDDTSNRSSSGSAILISKSCAQLGSMEVNEVSEPVQISFWNFRIPSSKRTKVRRRSPSPIEKLRRDLVKILNEQESYQLSESSEEVLLFEGDNAAFSSETGYGSILLKPPVSLNKVESELSGHIVENVAPYKETNMGSSCGTVMCQNNEINFGNILFDDPGNSYSKYTPQRCMNINPSNSESSKTGMEKSFLASHAIGSGTSEPATRHSDQPHFQVPSYGGASSGTIGTIKRPKKETIAQHPFPSNRSLSSFSPGAYSSEVNSMNPFEAELFDEDLLLKAFSFISSPSDELP